MATKPSPHPDTPAGHRRPWLVAVAAGEAAVEGAEVGVGEEEVEVEAVVEVVVRKHCQLRIVDTPAPCARCGGT